MGSDWDVSGRPGHLKIEDVSLAEFVTVGWRCVVRLDGIEDSVAESIGIVGREPEGASKDAGLMSASGVVGVQAVISELADGNKNARSIGQFHVTILSMSVVRARPR